MFKRVAITLAFFIFSEHVFADFENSRQGRRGVQAFQPVIQALDIYFQKNGSYPSSIEELALPSGVLDELRELDYYYHPAGDLSTYSAEFKFRYALIFDVRCTRLGVKPDGMWQCLGK